MSEAESLLPTTTGVRQRKSKVITAARSVMGDTLVEEYDGPQMSKYGHSKSLLTRGLHNTCCTRCKPGEVCSQYNEGYGGSPYCERSYPPAGFGAFLLIGFFVVQCCFVQCCGRSANARRRQNATRSEAVRDAARIRRQARQVELRRESFAESSPHELADVTIVDVADGASDIAAEEVHEVKAEERRPSREHGIDDFFDAVGPAAYAAEAPPS